ncbi:MAG TPA: glutamate--tRNA ligase family protein, partial [Burkholderiaceae bacterium]|nr:glutamate--tRNA ligase family protein [Burkholderiaceae bacterium]
MQPSKRTKPSRYVGRFAPSPSGPLHKGSLVTAMASYLDARAHNGRWLLRIEDIDGSLDAFADREILQQLRSLGMHWDADPIWQSQRQALYKRYFERLKRLNRTYGCG